MLYYSLAKWSMADEVEQSAVLQKISELEEELHANKAELHANAPGHGCAHTKRDTQTQKFWGVFGALD